MIDAGPGLVPAVRTVALFTPSPLLALMGIISAVTGIAFLRCAPMPFILILMAALTLHHLAVFISQMFTSQWKVGGVVVEGLFV